MVRCTILRDWELWRRAPNAPIFPSPRACSCGMPGLLGKRTPLLPLPLVPACSREPEKQWGDRGSRREGLGEWVGSHWGILSDSRERHLRSRLSGALPQGGHPQRPGGPEGSHGCGVGPTCCVCFHSVEAVAATPLVVAFRPRYIMSSAPPPVAPATRVPISPPLSCPGRAGVWGPAQGPEAQEGRGGGGAAALD